MSEAVSEEYWRGVVLREICFGDENCDTMNSKPVAQRWAAYFLDLLKLDERSGYEFSKRCVAEIQTVLEEGLSALEELILDGDDGTIEYQVKQEVKLTPKEGQTKLPFYEKQKSILHYAALAGNVKSLDILLQQGVAPLLNRNDFITGFTPFHIAFFTQNKRVMWHLIRAGAKIDIKDNYGATPLDYARLLRVIPSEMEGKMKSVSVYNPDTRGLDEWPIERFNSTFKTSFTPTYLADLSYIEELYFSGLQLQQPDEHFRKKYSSVASKSSGDENVFLAMIDEKQYKVGHGIFAKKSFKVGDFIVRYTGKLTKDEDAKDREFTVSTKIETVVLDGTHFRNLGPMANLSKTPNCEAVADFDKGYQDVLLVAVKDIAKGEQILWSDEEEYFQGEKPFVEMAGGDGFPTRVVEMNF